MPLIAPVFACAGCELHSCSCKAFFVPVSEAVCVPPPPGINFSCQCTADCFRHGPCCCSAGIVSQYVLLANANFTLLQITPNSHQRPVLKHGCAQDQGRQRDLTCLQVHETPSHHFLAPHLRRCKQAACQQARRQVQCHLALLPGALPPPPAGTWPGAPPDSELAAIAPAAQPESACCETPIFLFGGPWRS